MRVGDFSLTIPEASERGSGHAVIPHGKQYSIRLANFCSDRRCDAQVYMDGKDLGAYRLNIHGTMTLERSYLDNGRFTFFKVDSPEGKQVGSDKISKDEQGLVKVVFRPEKKPIPYSWPHQGLTAAPCSRAGPGGSSASRLRSAPEMEERACGGLQSFHARADSTRRLSAGVTGLTGHSNQSFYTVTNFDYDPSAEVTITLRLVADTLLEPREVKPVEQSNPTPAPVGG